MKIAMIQMAIYDRPKEENIDHAARLVSTIDDVDLIVLPEVWNIGYYSFDRYMAESEGDDGPTLEMVKQKAVETKTHIVSGSIIERERDQLYNTNYVIDPCGDIVCKYRKVHLFGIKSREKELLRPGAGIVVFNTDLGLFGLTTCYDLRFPEFYRALLDQGVEVFITSSSWPRDRLEHWILLNRARALENQAYVIACNAVGGSGAYALCGNSLCVGPAGDVVVRGDESERIIEAFINVEGVKRARASFPAVCDRMRG